MLDEDESYEHVVEKQLERFEEVLDHGATYGQVLLAIQSGFTSVMIDKSFAPFEENIAETSRVVQAAHAVGVSVEAELGTIGVSDKYGETGSEEILYTDPDDAARFIEATGADSLTIAVFDPKDR